MPAHKHIQIDTFATFLNHQSLELFIDSQSLVKTFKWEMNE